MYRVIPTTGMKIKKLKAKYAGPVELVKDYGTHFAIKNEEGEVAPHKVHVEI